MSDSLQPHELTSMPGYPVLHYVLKFAQTHVYWDSDDIQPSHFLLPLLLLPSIFPSIGSFPMSQFFTSGDQSIGASASALVLPMNIQEWLPLEFTRLILQSKQLSVFSSTTIQKHQFRAQPSLWSSSHIYTWLLEKHSFDYMDLCWQSAASAF